MTHRGRVRPGLAAGAAAGRANGHVDQSDALTGGYQEEIAREQRLPQAVVAQSHAEGFYRLVTTTTYSSKPETSLRQFNINLPRTRATLRLSPAADILPHTTTPGFSCFKSSGGTGHADLAAA